MKKTLAFLLSVAMVLTMGILIPFGSAVSAEEITYGATNAGQVASGYTPFGTAVSSWNQLTSEIENDPTGTFYLTQDIDALNNEGIAIIDTFTGTLDGNGHKISNLGAPLFATLSGTVKNIAFEAAIDIQSENMVFPTNNADNTIGFGTKKDNGHAFDSSYTERLEIDYPEARACGVVACIGNNCTINNVSVEATITDANYVQMEYCYKTLAEDVSGSPKYADANKIWDTIILAGMLLGKLDGGTNSLNNCHVVGNINLSKGNGGAGGLVGLTGSGSTLVEYKNVSSNMTIVAGGNSGLITGDGRSAMKFTNCLTEGALLSRTANNFGCFVGYCASKVECTDCKNAATLRRDDSNTDNSGAMGGMLGKINAQVIMTRCINEGAITARGNAESAAGGLVGCHRNSSTATFTDCVNRGTVSNISSSDSGAETGGLLGTDRKGNGVTFIRCANEADLSCTYGRIGGLVGLIDGDKKLDIVFEQCTNKGNLAVTTGKDNGGGFVGYLNPNSTNNVNMTFTDCINYGDISTKTGKAAGVVGYVNFSKASTGTAMFERCVNFGDCQSTELVGGIVGQFKFEITDVTAAYSLEVKDCVNFGKITQSSTGDMNSSGIVGKANLKSSTGSLNITNCVNNGDIETKGQNRCAGVVAWARCSQLTVSNCANTGSISCTNTSTAKYGVTGYTDKQGGTLTLNKLYSLNGTRASESSSTNSGVVSTIPDIISNTDGMYQSSGTTINLTQLKSLVSKFISAQGTIGYDLSLEYTAYVDPALDAEEIEVKFTRNNKFVVVDGEAGAEANTFVFSYTGINPQCMGDDILAELIVDGNVVATKTYSFKQYVENVMSDYEDNTAMLELCVATLKYGAAAQVYAQYKTDALVNEEVKTHEFITALPEFSYNMEKTDSGAVDAEVTGAGIYFDNALHVYFTVTSEASSLKVLLDDEVVEPTMISEGVYRVISKPIAVRDIENSVEITLFNGDIQGQTVTYSITDYMLRTYARGTASEAMTGLLDALSMLYATAEANA